MIKFVFKNMEKSELAKNIVAEKLSDTVERFPDLKGHKLQVTLFVENRPTQAGPDIFGVKLVVTGTKFKDVILEKKDSNLYTAVGQLCEALLERLNRAIDKARVKNRNIERRHFDLEAPSEQNVI